MKHMYYSVYDVLAETFTMPTELHNDNVAMRTFKEACKTVDGYKQHPEDMQIFKVGEFDDETGDLIPEVRLLMKGEKNSEI